MDHALDAVLRQRPGPDALDWVLRHQPPGTRVASLRRLRGGTASATHAINLRNPDGELIRTVLRRYVRSDWLQREPDLAAREASTLKLLATSEVAAARLLAVDPSGAHCDAPAVLMSRLPGGIDVAPTDLGPYVDQMAAVLPAVHRTKVDRRFKKTRPYFSYVALDTLQVPAWSDQPDAWAAIIAAARHDPSPVQATFIHRDYHPGNVVWARGKLTGIVDWVNASFGPPGIDIGHGRVNLAVLFGLDAANGFLDACLRLLGDQPHQLFWDCRAALEFAPTPPDLAQWHDTGRSDLTLPIAVLRLDAYVHSLAIRLR